MKFLRKFVSITGPGLAVAATGLGAGDIATGTLAGSQLGTAVLWAVILGVVFKYTLNEGLARYQLDTGKTLLEGILPRMGNALRLLFFAYFLLWSFLVAVALMNASGVVFYAIAPLQFTPLQGKIVYGILHSLLALAIAWRGAYKVLENILSVLILCMLVMGIATAIALASDWSGILQGMVIPRIPRLDQDGLSWTLALMGGIGGTLTVLSYGYWIREAGRSGSDSLAVTRLDLFFAYFITGIFGIAMVIIGSTISVEGSGSTLVVKLAESLALRLGVGFKWMFLIGAWATVFSSVLGVWQGVPYLFVDCWKQIVPAQKKSTPVLSHYKLYMLALALLPIVGLWIGFAKMQKIYAIAGALFMPILAVWLLWLNIQRKEVSAELRNTAFQNLVLYFILSFFLVAGIWEIWQTIS